MNTNKTNRSHTKDSILGEKPISKLPVWRDMMISRITAVARKVNHKSYLRRLMNAVMLVAMLLPNIVGVVEAAPINSGQGEDIDTEFDIGEPNLEIELTKTVGSTSPSDFSTSLCPDAEGYCFRSDEGYFSVHSFEATAPHGKIEDPERALQPGGWVGSYASGDYTNVRASHIGTTEERVAWIIYDLGEVFEITQFDSFDYHDGNPTQVSYSTDAVNWEHFYSQYKRWHTGSGELFTYYNDPANPKQVRYIRYRVQEVNNVGNCFRIAWFSFLSDTPSSLHPEHPKQSSLSSSFADCDMGAIATCVNGLAADPVNTQTGGFSYGVSDLSIPTEAGPLALNLEYSSTAMETEVDLYNPSVGDTSLGYGWTHNHDIGLRFDTVPDPDEVIFKGASANQYTFYDNGGGTYTPYAGITATLSYDSGTSTYTLEDAGHNLYEFDSAGKLLTWTNAGGQAFAYSYGTNGLLDRVTGPDGVRYLDFDYDLQDRLTLVSDHTARSASITYDANNNVETFTDAMGKIWHYGYDTSHLMTTVQVEDPANPGVLIDRTRNLYDTQGRVVCQQEGDEHPLVTSYQEVTGGNLCKQADGNIAVATSFSYDNVQSRTVIKDPNDNLSMDYHNRSRRILTDEEDALGNRTVNTVDDNFRPVSMKDAEGNPTEIEWSPDGYNLTQVTNADNKTTQLGYDSLNNLTSMTDPDNNITNYYYDDSNYPTQISEIEYSPDGGTTWLATTFTYYGPGDVAPGKLSQVTDPVGNDTFYTYDQYGQVLTITTGYGLDERTTSFTYDTLGRTVEIVDPAGIITRTEFDAAGRVTRAIENCKENYPTDCMSSYPQNYEENGKIYNVATSYTYDFQGNQIAVTDTQGVVTRTYYDSYNRAVTTVRNLTGQSIGTSTPPARGSGAGDENIRMDYTFDTVGNRIATTDPLGVVNRTYFNEIDQPVKIVQNMTGNIGDAAPPAYNPAYPDQNVFTDTIYNKNGSMIATTDVNGITTRTYYDVLNRPATIVQNLTGQAISETVPPVRNSANATENLRTDIYYDARGNAIATEDPAGNITRTYYDDINRPVTVVQNLTGQSISTSTPPARGSTPDENIRTDTTYDENGNVILTEDPQGRLTKNVYNEFDQLSTVTVNFLDGQPQNHQNEYNIVSTYTYDSQGNRVSITDTAGVVTYFEYDGLGRVTAEVQNYVNGGPNDSETNLRTEYTFNAVGNKETAAAADGVVTKYEYDSLRRITAETHNYVNGGPVDHQTNLRTQYGYDAAGNRVSLTDANNHTTGYSYDGLNRMTVETDANNHSTTRVYDGAGNLQSQTDANNLTTSYGYDALNRMTSITDSLNNVTQYGYDVLGNKTSMTDANGVITTYEYDAVGRLEAVVENYVDGSTADHETNVRTEYGYDMGGNLTSILDGNNHSRSFVYDNLNRLTDEINALNHTTSYTFDAAGNMVLKTEANGQDIDHSYDALNRIVGIDYNGDQVNDVTYTYDLSGQVDFTTDSMGTTDWTYDPIGRITSVVDPFSSTVSYGYDAVGNRTSLAYPDTKSVTYAYDPANRLEQITDWNSEITSYTYDDADRLTGMSLPNGISAGYTYDDASRITDISYTKTEEVFAQYAYTYDNAGNRTQMQEMIQLAGQSLPVVEVTVKDNLDQPVAGFTVHALDDVVETGVSAVTDDAGIARISLPDGNYRFRVQRDGTEFHSDAINHCTVPTCTEASIELSILAGTVVDDLGSPAPGIQLSVYDDAGDTGLKGITDALGLVELAVPDGCYQLYSEEEGQQVFSNEDCTAPAHAATLTIDLADALTTTVTAEDDAGTPQENVPVYAFAGEVYTGLTGASDVNGEVTLAIPEDDYRYAPDLPAGSPLADVQITVTVEDTSSAPQAGLTVFALSGSDYNDYKTYAGRSDVTDAAGQVVLTLPQIGQYRFRVKDGSQSYYSDLTALCDPLTCSAVTVTIPGTGGDVVVTATDGLGQAIADNMVYAFDEDTYTGIFAETDVNGQATLSLPEGDYRFRTEVDEKFFFSDTVNHCTPPTCTSAQIAMPAVHAVTVSVQDEAANPQQDVVVYAFEGATYAEMSYTGNSGKSDELGEVNFELPAGNYWFAYKQGDAAVDAGETAVCVLPGCTTSTLTTTQNGTTTYVYDPLNRLTGATEVGTATREYGYTYDAVGNRLTKTIDSTTVNYGYDIANRLTSVDSVTYTWDNNGNLLSDGVFTYTYDAMNRLASATDGVDTYAYAYNASGDRLQQTVNAVPTNYTLDLAAGLAQVLDDGTNAYLYGRDRIAQEDTNGMLYFIPDALGSVRKLVDANGDVVNAASYSPYGETSGMAETSYGFTGEWTDAMGLVNLRTRYYAPGDGRFVSRDTWKGDYNNPLSLNKWGYVEGNPITRIDPSGRTSLISLVKFNSGDINNPNDPNAPQWDYREKAAANRAVFDVASAYAEAYNLEMFRRDRAKCGPELYLLTTSHKLSPYEAFLRIHGGSMTFWRLGRTSQSYYSNSNANYWGMSAGKQDIYVFSNATTDKIATRPRFFVHEIGHSFEKAIHANSGFWIRSEMQAGTEYWDKAMYWRSPGYGGFAGGFLDWQFSKDEGPYDTKGTEDYDDDTDGRGEIFADMFIGWVYNQWEDSLLGYPRSDFMDHHMPIWIADAIGE